ncbi:MAG: GntR family transcriptional regulator [Caldilinea sp.]|jgi:GntR family transcriptional regulator|nr:GntR family transcriptional regulator [Caldilinea sp.]
MTVNLNGATPLYIQIKNLLQRQIEEGVYAVGDRLPSERELSETYAVSRMTARQALHLLQQSGLVQTQVGKGTYVSRKIDQDLQELTSFTQDMVNRGLLPSSRVLCAELRPADTGLTTRLSAQVGEELVVLSRLRLANGNPVAIEVAHLRHALCPQILQRHDFATESLYRVLQHDYGIRLMWARQVIAARLAVADERTLLNTRGHAPVLSLERVTYDERDQPVEYVRSCYHGERYQLHTVLRNFGQPSVDEEFS